jgi:hypothetical protein
MMKKKLAKGTQKKKTEETERTARKEKRNREYSERKRIHTMCVEFT